MLRALTPRPCRSKGYSWLGCKIIVHLTTSLIYSNCSTVSSCDFRKPKNLKCTGIIVYCHHHHHHIHFRALFSSTEGWAFWQVFLEGVLSTQNGSESQQNPYLASFCHSQALHPMISLVCQIFSVQPHSACVLLQSSLCWCQALWEGSLS